MPVYPRTPIGVLHLPDLMLATQRVASGECTVRDAATAALHRMAALQSDQVGRPVLVVATGNLTEHARPDEYDAACALLTILGNDLGINIHQIIVIPGDHDVNRLKCHAHFLEREANGEPPTPPYWEKWQPFATLLRRLHGTELAKDQPWSFAEYPDLHVVVAGLNSTMAQSHLKEDDYGFLGEEQLRWFSDRLAVPAYRTWLRIATVHHRPGGLGAGRLRDSNRLTQLLGPHLDLIVHGQAIGRQVRNRHRIPLVARSRTGACQVIEVHADRLLLRSDPRDVKQTPLPHPPPRPTPTRTGTVRQSPADRLIDDVTAICRLRYPGTEITPVRWHGHGCVGYLRISPRQARSTGPRVPAEQQPVGVFDTTPTREGVVRFVDEVVARFRAGGVTPDAKLVHTGGPADQALRDWAGGRGVEILTFPTFQLGHDLDQFAARQAAQLRDDPVYPAAIYVPQRYTLLQRTDQTETGPGPDLLAWLRAWIDQPHGRLIVVLGTFGHGKTFLLHELAQRMRTDGCQALPILIDLRGFEKAYSLDELVAVQLSRGGQRQIDLDTFRYLRRAGRVALLFDGFDELASRVSYERATNHLDTIVQAAEGRAKVIVTCRDQHFLTDAEVLSALGTRPGAERCVVKLADFDDRQILAFLTNRLGGQDAADARLALLRDVKDLLGLSRNPRMLAFVTDLGEELLRSAQSVGRPVTSADLYQEIIDRWLIYEVGRLDRPGPLAPGKDDLLTAVTDLALRLWEVPEDGLGLDDLGTAATTLSQLAAIDPAGSLDPQETAHLLGSSTLLVRYGERRFTFVHHSVREWLVANHLRGHVATDETGTGTTPKGATANGTTPSGATTYHYLLGRPMSPLVIDFLCSLAGEGVMRSWAERVLSSGTAPAGVGRNAVEILRHLQVAASVPLHMAGYDLRGKDLSGHSLRDADLAAADLTDARLVGTDLTGANLAGATLVGARLDRATLRGADLTDADLTAASLLGAHLEDATLTRTRLRRAAMVGAIGVPPVLDALDTHGAALADRAAPQPQYESHALVLAVAVDSCGRLVAGGGADGVIRIWDLGTGVPLRSLAGHTGAVHAVAFSADGRRLASAGEDETIRIWDTATGDAVHTLAGHDGWIRALAYHPDGDRLASAGHDADVRIWDTATGTAVQTLAGHADRVRAIAYHPDGRHLASAGEDETIQIWDTATGDTVHTLTGHTGTVHALAYSPDGARLASAGDDRELRIWDPATGEPSALAGHTGWIRALAYAPDGQRLASAGDDRTIRIWDPATGQLLATLAEHTGWVRSLAYHRNGRHLASAGDDRTVRIWDTAPGRQLRAIGDDGDEIRALCFSRNNRWLASGSSDGAVRVWSVAAGTWPRLDIRHEDAVNAVAFAPGGDGLASAGDDRTIRIWDPATGQPRHTLTGHTGPIRALAYSPTGSRVASAGEDAVIRIWGTVTGAPTRALSGHGDTVNTVAFSPDGESLASAGDDRTIRIWDPATGQPRHTLTGHTATVQTIAYSADGRRLASGDEDGIIRIWDPATGQSMLTLDRHTDAVNTVAFSPDNHLLASASNDGTIHVWSLANGRIRHTLAGRTGWLHAIAYAPNGRRLAAAGADRAIRLWDPARERLCATLVRLAGGGSAVLLDDLRYALDGAPRGEYWYAIGMCRFEPGELDPYLPALQPIPPGTRLW